MVQAWVQWLFLVTVVTLVTRNSYHVKTRVYWFPTSFTVVIHVLIQKFRARVEFKFLDKFSFIGLMCQNHMLHQHARMVHFTVYFFAIFHIECLTFLQDLMLHQLERLFSEFKARHEEPKGLPLVGTVGSRSFSYCLINLILRSVWCIPALIQWPSWSALRMLHQTQR